MRAEAKIVSATGPYCDSGSHRVWVTFPELNTTLRACFRRVRSWRLPRNWSSSDWSEEIIAIEAASACQAELEFDPKHQIPFGAFVYHRVMARCLTRYRQEWTYALRFSSDSAAGPVSGASVDDGSEKVCESAPGEPAVQDPESSINSTFSYEVLYSALASLDDSDRRLIEQLYWEDQTEAKVAQQLAITQQAVSKRKRAVLVRLKMRLSASDKDSDWLVVKRNGRRN